MNLVRFYNPRESVSRNLADELFNSVFRNNYFENNVEDCRCNPATNILENDKEFRLELLLPGFKKEDIRLNFEKDTLSIKTDKAEAKKNGNDDYEYERREFGTYDFEKHFHIPESVATDKIKAKFENGILNLILPKKEEALEKAPVEIKIG